MENENREGYVIDADGFAHGPYRSESEADVPEVAGERIEWLQQEQINAFGEYAGESR